MHSLYTVLNLSLFFTKFIYSFKLYFLSYVFALSSINSENINCVIESKITIFATYENDVNSIDTPNTIGKNIFNILLIIDLNEMHMKLKNILKLL